MATYGSEQVYRAAQLAAIELLERGDWGDFGGLGETSDVLAEHERMPEDPFEAPDHYLPGTAHVSVNAGTAEDFGREVAPTVVDYVPRREPYSVRGIDITDPVTAFCSPADLGMANFPGNVLRGAATSMRRAGSAAANAGEVLGTDMLMASRASVQGIMGRVISALEMLESGWDVGGPPDSSLELRHTSRESYDDARAMYPEHVRLYVPDDWSDRETAALVSLMVEGGPAAYRWGYAGADPGGDELTGGIAPREALMPAGAQWRWPGGWSRFLLVTERDKLWNVPFGGDALSIDSLGGLLRRMIEAFGQKAFHDSAKAAALQNRAYCPPSYERLQNARNIGVATVETRACVRAAGGVQRIAAPARNMAKFAPGDLLRAGAGWAPPVAGPLGAVGGHGVVPGGHGGGVWVKRALPSPADIAIVGNAFAAEVDDRPPGGAGQQPARYKAGELADDGLVVITNHGRRVYAWGWDPPDMAGLGLGADAMMAVVDAWVRLAVHFMPEQAILRDPSEDWSVAGRDTAMRTVYGTVCAASGVTLPRLNLDGWWPVLIGLSVMRHDRVRPTLDRTALRPVFTRYAADVHLLTHRVLYESGMSVADLSDAVGGAKVLSRFPPGYRPGWMPHVFSDTSMPYGNYECLETGALLGGGNATEGVGLAVPGSWKWDGVKRRAAPEEGAPSVVRGTLRALDAVARKVYFLGGSLRLSETPDVPVYIVKAAGMRLYHPYSLPVRVRDDRIPTGVEYTAIGSGSLLLASGKQSDVGRAHGVI